MHIKEVPHRALLLLCCYYYYRYYISTIIVIIIPNYRYNFCYSAIQTFLTSKPPRGILMKLPLICSATTLAAL